MFAENTDYEILTPTGWQDFRGITQTGKKKTFRLTLAKAELYGRLVGAARIIT